MVLKYTRKYTQAVTSLDVIAVAPDLPLVLIGVLLYVSAQQFNASSDNESLFDIPH